MKKTFVKILAVAALCTISVNAKAALYTDSYGSIVPSYYQNDDSSFGPQNLGFSLNFFGNVYNQFYINNNGNITFGNGTYSYTPSPLNSQNTMPMIAPYWTDLDTRSGGVASNVYLSQSADKDIITWSQMGYYSQNYSGRATFQLVLNNPNNVPVGEGLIGFFYGTTTSGSDGHAVTVGFGDGLTAINPGEISVASGSSNYISQLVNDTHIWFDVNNGTPVVIDPIATPEPGTIILFGAGIAGLAFWRKKRS